MAEETEADDDLDVGSDSKGKVILVILLFFLIIAGISAFFLLQPEEEKEEEVFHKIQEKPEVISPFYLDLGEFVINLADRKYFLKTKIALVFHQDSPRDWLSFRVPIVKDTIISYLELFTAKQLADEKSRRKMKISLLQRLNSLFSNRMLKEDTEPIKKILFEEFYTQ